MGLMVPNALATLAFPRTFSGGTDTVYEISVQSQTIYTHGFSFLLKRDEAEKSQLILTIVLELM